jgi:hypothetical protein
VQLPDRAEEPARVVGVVTAGEGGGRCGQLLAHGDDGGGIDAARPQRDLEPAALVGEGPPGPEDAPAGVDQLEAVARRAPQRPQVLAGDR